MKHFSRKLPVKIICFILCIVSLAITAGSVIGAIAIGESGFYSHSKDYMLEESAYGLFTSDAHNKIIHEAVNEMAGHYDFSSDFTNLRFQVFDPEGKVILQNTKNTLEADSNFWKYFCSFQITTTTDNYHLDYLGREAITNTEDVYVVCAYLEEGLPANDKYALVADVVNLGYSLRYAIYPIGIVALFVSIFCFITLMCASARKPKSEELHPGALNWVPFDVLLLIIGFTIALCLEITYDIFYYQSDIFFATMLIILGILSVNMALGLCMSVAARIKQRTLLTNTVIWRCCKLIWKVLKWLGTKLKKIVGELSNIFLNIPLIWRTLVIVFGVTILEFIVILGCWWDSDVLLMFWLLEKIIVIPLAIYGALFMRKLQKGGIALAKGDLSYHIDTKMMFWDFKRHGENLNSIAAGMATAVEERLQSERMKTELITNVSHDIKTPLTSIINYAGLIEDEPCNSEKHKEYSAVLIRKSAHLKHLLDDLVEVAKATTGNLDVDLLPCEASILLTQAAGEFEQRCQAANLVLITKQPEENIRIMADSRRIWRVFENLMSNACKYSLPGSRVYLSLEQLGNEAVFTFRNTSSTALDITPEELMERFVRGDASRTTEGNGLGLSIARSLTELQNGKMDITIDGDLFKVVLRFPVIV